MVDTMNLDASLICDRSFNLEVFSLDATGKPRIDKKHRAVIEFKVDGSVSGAEGLGGLTWSIADNILRIHGANSDIRYSFSRLELRQSRFFAASYTTHPKVAGDARLSEIIKATRILSSVPETMEFTGEFGEEVNNFIPYIYWLHSIGEMQNRKILTYKGMEAFYYFLTKEQISTKVEPRKYAIAPDFMPHGSGLLSKKGGMEWAPPYRRKFRDAIKFEKPILVVHNKYTTEWGAKPVNFIELDTLNKIFSQFKDSYQIIFFEAARAKSTALGYTQDHQKFIPYNDYEVAKDHKDVIIFGDYVAARKKANYNDLKLKIFSNSYYFITTQGGNAHMASLFPGSLVIVLHKAGKEITGSYSSGVFQYLTNQAPHYLITRNTPDFMEATQALTDSEVIEGEVFLGPKGREVYKRFNPWKTVAKTWTALPEAGETSGED